MRAVERDRAHLVEIDFAAEAGGGERGFGTGETSADDANFHDLALRLAALRSDGTGVLVR